MKQKKYGHYDYYNKILFEKIKQIKIWKEWIEVWGDDHANKYEIPFHIPNTKRYFYPTLHGTLKDQKLDNKNHGKKKAKSLMTTIMMGFFFCISKTKNMNRITFFIMTMMIWKVWFIFIFQILIIILIVIFHQKEL